MAYEHAAPDSAERTPVTLLTAGTAPDRRTQHMAQTLAEAGCAVTLVVNQDVEVPAIPGVLSIQVPFSTTSFRSDADFLPIDLRRDWSAELPEHAACLAAALAHPSSVYIAQDLPTLAAAAIAAQCYDAYLVYDVTETYTASRQLSVPQQYALRAAERVLLSFADVVMTASISHASWMKASYSIARPEVILDAPRGVQHSAARREYLGVDTARLLLAVHGAGDDAPWLCQLLTAMQRLAMPHLVLALPAQAEQHPEVQEHLQQTGLTGQVGFFPDDLAPILAATDGVIVPGSSDPVEQNSASAFLLDAVSAGVPILTRPSPEAMRYIMHPDIGCCMPLHDAESIRTALMAFVRKQPASVPRATAQRGALCWAEEGPRLLDTIRGMSSRPSKSVLHGIVREAQELLATGQHAEAKVSAEAVAQLWPEHTDVNMLLASLASNRIAA